MPFDSRAQRESSELGNEAADTRANLAAKFQAAQNDLGFGTGADNPYSRSAENREQLADERRRITNTAGNQLYAGSTLNRQSEARGEYDKAQKALEQGFAEDQADYNRGVAQTGRDEEMGLAQIREGAVDRAAAAEPAPLGVGSRRRPRGRGRVGGRAPVGNRRNRGRGRV